MQQRVVFLPAHHPAGKNGAVREGQTTPLGRAVVSGVLASPVETQNAGFGIHNHLGLILDAQVLECGAGTKPAAVELLVLALDEVLQVAGWARTLSLAGGSRLLSG